MARRKTRQLNIGGVKVGADAPVTVQSMTNTDTRDVAATVAQINALTDAGCEIARVAVPDMDSASAVGEIKKAIAIPLVADIHFDWRLAIACLEGGVDCLRINPGNIGDTDRIRQVVKGAAAQKVPIRIGVNAGSLEKDILARYGHPTPEALVESAMRHISILEEMDFRDIKVSLKASSVPLTVKSYRLLAEQVDYPFHIGITEAGTLFSGTIKSAAGLGILLSEGIGDTMRVSLTGDPVDEVRAGWEILKALELRKRGATIISCPTCGRLKFNSIAIAKEIEASLANVKDSVKIAIMGCVVNGPGEAMEADIGIAGGDGAGMLYIKGVQVRKVKEQEIVKTVLEEVDKLLAERRN
jgi:(E)-4-hydroxy-3-methylbut-2-enyl-diphosphate synthase